jgi:thimet oligopeptidase
VKKESYDFDTQALRPYFPYDRVKQGVLDVTSKMFGVTYRRIPGAAVWDPSVECWEMDEDGKLVGRFYLDMHPRKNKFNHAAQFDIRTGVEGRQIAEAALVCNLPGGKAGDPGLCDFDDVNTFFHEFGHLLHNLFAGHQRWCGIGGIRTEADFIEAPSQMLEEWMRDPKVLQVFAKHYETGAPVPADLISKMRRADEFGDIDPKGISVRRQMVLADLSLSIYDRPPSEVNTDSLNARLTRKYTPYPYVPDTHFQASFGHLYGYGAAYYTYMWSLVIAKDMFTQFDPNDLLDPKVAKRYRDAVLAPGGSRPAAVLVRNFLHREPGFDAYERWLNKFPASSMKVE